MPHTIDELPEDARKQYLGIGGPHPDPVVLKAARATVAKADAEEKADAEAKAKLGEGKAVSAAPAKGKPARPGAVKVAARKPEKPSSTRGAIKIGK
jgi:hypothetical protein